jgi:hypothetical protein
MLPRLVRPAPRPGEVPQSAASRPPHRRDYARCPPDQFECLTAGPFRAGAAFPVTRHFSIHVTWPKLSGSACAEYVLKRPLLSVVVQVKADSWAVPKAAHGRHPRAELRSGGYVRVHSPRYRSSRIAARETGAASDKRQPAHASHDAPRARARLDPRRRRAGPSGTMNVETGEKGRGR